MINTLARVAMFLRRGSSTTKFPSLHSVRASALLVCVAACCLLSSCTTSNQSRDNQIFISVTDQKMLLVSEGAVKKSFPVSTSKFGYSSKINSGHTPLGSMAVAAKIGGGYPAGAVFKSRRATGEVLKPNAPGRDPIVSRILWLRGLEPKNRNTFSRFIYIHGTPEERYVGYPVSYGCIRMKSRHIIDLYDWLAVGSRVTITYDAFETEENDDEAES
ncbi:MAG: L,D-transpeptidase family protein [Akkermansiaceae bacterium]